MYGGIHTGWLWALFKTDCMWLTNCQLRMIATESRIQADCYSIYRSIVCLVQI